MTWAKMDDRFHEHPRTRKVWRSCPMAIGLHVMAITYSAGNLLDGRIDHEWVADQIPSATARRKATAALVEAGQWIDHGTHYEIRDYLDYNPSREKVQADRARDAERKARGRSSPARLRPVGIHEDSA